MTTRLVRLAVVNDYELILRGVAAMLEPFGDRVRVVELDVLQNPHVGVDIAMFDTYGHARGGVDRVRALAAEPSVGAVVVYTWELPPGQVDALLAAGARGVLSKSTPVEELLAALDAIESGEIVVSPAFRRHDAHPWPGSDVGLTARESEVAAFVGEGLSNRAIADALSISEHTVKSHLRSIFQKLGVTSRAQLVALVVDDPGFRRVRRVG